VRRWRVTTTKTNDYHAQIGEMVVCDPTAAGFIVYLPLGGQGGDEVAVHNGSASVNAITVTPTGGAPTALEAAPADEADIERLRIAPEGTA
jgi:hypothetical protein